jgi:acyl-CoA reductase-like NAD-dependent aldehyde dehydrogenase
MTDATTPRRSGADSARQFGMLIDGQWVPSRSGQTFSCVDPYTEESWGSVPRADAQDVNLAVAAARRAFDQDGWPQTPPAQRALLLRKLGALIETHLDALVRQQIWENGRLIKEMHPGTAAIAKACHYYAGLAETLHGVTIPASMPNMLTYTVREPLGVVAAITPWNAPLVLLGWKLLPALAAGNTIVIKPSEITPTSTLLLAELIEKAGFPKGVANVVTGYGDPAGQTLTSHPGVDKIAFTGSTATGRKIAHAAAERFVRTSLELGGKSPNIIFADANLNNAVNGALAGIFSATGQACMAGSRVLVEATVYDQVAERIVTQARRMIAGDPLDPGTQLGPLASKAQLDKVMSYFDIARSQGVRILTGGRRLERRGYFVEPTVFGDVDNACRVAQEEIFGPVVALIRFSDEAQALAIANDTSYGLAAGVWTDNLQRAHRVVTRLRAGTVWVNNYRLVSHALPFGGYKQSGVGREMGPDALHEFTEVKSVWIDSGNPVHFPVG